MAVERHAARGPNVATTAAAERMERVLAVGRAFLTVTALVAIYIDPSEPARLRELTYGVLGAYATYSVVVLATMSRLPRIRPWHTYVLHGMDVFWASVLTFISLGPVSPFFLFFLFAVLASAYRWGFRETFGTTLITIAVFLLETAGASARQWPLFAAVDFDTNTTILRVAYLLLTGVLLGYFAEQDKLTRAELTAAAATAREPHIRVGLGGAVTSFGRTVMTAFHAAKVVVVVRDHETRRTLCWQIERTESGTMRTKRDELDPAGEEVWLFTDRGSTWIADCASTVATSPTRVRVADPGYWRLRSEQWHLPQALVAGRWQVVAAANMAFEREWHGRVYVFGSRWWDVERRVHFLRTLADHATPTLTNAFLLRRLRAKAGAAERARVARELHDGAIQSLFAIDMKIEALRRAEDVANVRTELEGVQHLVRHEVASLRDLMHALRPVELDASDQLPDVLAAVVDRFQRESGIGARFVTSADRVAIPPSRAVELVKIVQEALVNVRKHSGAGQVLVRLTSTDRECQVVVEDDGKGSGFEGRLTLSELDEHRVGPVVIKERARVIGADLAVESGVGGGTRLEVSVPVEAHV